jgi:death-on-curing protein
VLYPSKDEVVELQRRLIDTFGGTHGLGDEGLLDSALAAPQFRWPYEGADLVGCAATLAFHLTQAHAFVDGNKRLGAAAAEVFLQLNGARLTTTNEEIVDRFLRIAAGQASRDDVEGQFRQWVSLDPPSQGANTP